MALFPIAKPKAHSLTGRITQPLVLAAFKAVKRNRGAAGIDKVSINMFAANLAENLLALERDLKDGSFVPFPLRRKYIPKEPGKFRPLGIPAVRDRIAQEVVRRLLHPIFEPLFHDASFGVISPLLANIVLNHLDGRLHERGYRFVRYADDFVVLCQTQAQAEEALTLVTQTLTELGLSLSAEKTRITTYRKGYSFLGFVLSRRSRRMRHKSERKFQDKVRELTCRSHNLDAPVIVKLNQVIRGTAHYFATRWFTGRYRLRELDAWIRRRLRCMKYKCFSYHNNRRFRVKQFEQLGLLRLESFCGS